MSDAFILVTFCVCNLSMTYLHVKELNAVMLPATNLELFGTLLGSV